MCRSPSCRPSPSSPRRNSGARLAYLRAAEFLYETSLFPELEYTFKHALTHDVAYGSLLQERRRALHARVVEAIERLYPDRLVEQVEHLAHHAFRGEAWEKAVPYFRQAGTKAATHSAYREAATCFDQALVALTHLPESRTMLEQGVDVRLDLRNALYPLGERDRIFDSLREADTVSTALDDRHRRGWVATYLGTHFWGIGDHDRAVECGQRALDLASGLDDVALRVQASSRLGWIYHVLGAHRRAIDLLTQSLSSLEGELSTQRLGMPTLPSVMSRTYLCWSLAELGRFPEAAVRAKEGLRIAEGVGEPFSRVTAYTAALRPGRIGVPIVGEPFSRVTAYTALGSLRRSQGDFDGAIAVLERARALCQEANIVAWLAITASELGYAYALSRRLGDALPLLEQSTDRNTVVPFGALWIGWLGESYLLAGRADDAARVARRALELARVRRERGYEAWALRLLGNTAAQRDPPDAETAEVHYRQALTLAEELGMRPLVAHCHLGLGTLYRRIGKREPAQEHLTTATTMYREMDMGFWLEKADAELGGVER